MSNFLGIEKKYSTYESSKVAVLPIPYEATTSYGHGTRNGPAAIVKASQMVEYYDEELDRESLVDFGIATLKPVAFGKAKGERAMSLIRKSVAELLHDGKFPVCLGGEHTVSGPIVEAFHDQYGNDFTVLQIDAHSDLRETYQGSPLSHACVMKRIFDFHKDIVQVGIRAQCIEERQLIVDNRIATFYAKDLTSDRNWIDEVLSRINGRVYITIDCDGLDPTVIPATGTPEPGGLTWQDTLRLMRKVFGEREVVGFDIVELAPVKNLHAVDYALAKLAYRLMGYKFCLR